MSTEFKDDGEGRGCEGGRGGDPSRPVPGPLKVRFVLVLCAAVFVATLVLALAGIHAGVEALRAYIAGLPPSGMLVVAWGMAVLHVLGAVIALRAVVATFRQPNGWVRWVGVLCEVTAAGWLLWSVPELLGYSVILG